MRLLLTITMMTSALVNAESGASGTLTINKDTFNIRNVVAITTRDASGGSVIRIIATDRGPDQDFLDDYIPVWELAKLGYHGLIFDIKEDKQNYFARPVSATLNQEISMFGTFDAGKMEVLTKQRVEGLLEKAETVASDEAEVKIAYRIAFACDVAPPEAVPKAADPAARSSPPANAYMALLDAVRSGNKQKTFELMPQEKRSTLENPEALKWAQEAIPRNVQVFKNSERGDRAKVLVRAQQDGKWQRGKIYLKRLNGKWIVMDEDWVIE